jgi:transcriptional regulator with XRE-family HTH domain
MEPDALPDQRTLSATLRGMDELGACLRTWRDRLDPAEAGLNGSRRRRAPGLRREEVARLAGLSVDYLACLEQGRASASSPSVLAPLARALRLSEDERAHLFRVAGQALPAPGEIDRRITPGIQRVLDRLADVPVLVTDAAWEVIAMNPPAIALLGHRRDNVLRRHFSGQKSRILRTPEEVAAMEEGWVGDLHRAAGRYANDGPLRALIEELRRVSPRFEELWQQRPVAHHVADRKTIEHPDIGRITVDCDVLTVAGSDLRLVVYTAPPGSDDARALALLAHDAVAQVRDGVALNH